MQKIRIYNLLISAFLQGIVLFFIAFSFTADPQPLKQSAHVKAFVCSQSQAGGPSLREGQENHSTPSLVQLGLQEIDFIFAELVHTRKLITSSELLVSLHQFNPFYNLVTIHAP